METSELLLTRPLDAPMPPPTTFVNEVLHRADELSRMVEEVEAAGPNNTMALQFMYAANKAYFKARAAMR